MKNRLAVFIDNALVTDDGRVQLQDIITAFGVENSVDSAARKHLKNVAE